MNYPTTKHIAILLGKVIFIAFLIATNIFNFFYCMLWMPGHDQIRTLFYKKRGGKEEVEVLQTFTKFNLITHKLSIIIILVSLMLLIISNKNRWLGVAGMLTFLGLMYQLYIFDAL